MREEDIIINTLTSIEEIAIVVVELGLYDLARSFRHKLGDKMSFSAQVDDQPSISEWFNQLKCTFNRPHVLSFSASTVHREARIGTETINFYRF